MKVVQTDSTWTLTVNNMLSLVVPMVCLFVYSISVIVLSLGIDYTRDLAWIGFVIFIMGIIALLFLFEETCVTIDKTKQKVLYVSRRGLFRFKFKTEHSHSFQFTRIHLHAYFASSALHWFNSQNTSRAIQASSHELSFSFKGEASENHQLLVISNQKIFSIFMIRLLKFLEGTTITYPNGTVL